jgi:hypothetical protein
MFPVFHAEGFLEPENSVRLPQFKQLVYAFEARVIEKGTAFSLYESSRMDRFTWHLKPSLSREALWEFARVSMPRRLSGWASRGLHPPASSYSYLPKALRLPPPDRF